jgi:hypothetical protein
VLKSLPGQLIPLLSSGDPAVRRLFPPAYADDAKMERDYRELMGDELQARHRRSLEVLEETAGAESLDEEQAVGWLGALNDIRLVLGTQLDVAEDVEPLASDDPRAPTMELYMYLTMLQGELVDVLAASL